MLHARHSHCFSPRRRHSFQKLCNPVLNHSVFLKTKNKSIILHLTYFVIIYPFPVLITAIVTVSMVLAVHCFNHTEPLNLDLQEQCNLGGLWAKRQKTKPLLPRFTSNVHGLQHVLRHKDSNSDTLKNTWSNQVMSTTWRRDKHSHLGNVSPTISKPQLCFVSAL